MRKDLESILPEFKNNVKIRERHYFGKSFSIIIVFLLTGLSLYGWDFENREYSISLTIPSDWSRSQDLEQKISSCILSLKNSKNSSSFNLIVVEDSDDNFENFSKKEKQTYMEQTLIKTTCDLETQLGITMDNNYLKKINGRYYGVFVYKLEGFYVIQGVAVYGNRQYTYTMTAITNKSKDNFFEIVNSVKYLR